ncbi:hypothetical protein [Pandoraea sp. NE5]|uniref:hypothetical protein n=1 Tax=Pandoraea sp. NE5 TaxID=2904129 RepID=UPI0021C46819|nr:hypothetical protein [Pandoraea sp. NE5]
MIHTIGSNKANEAAQLRRTEMVRIPTCRRIIGSYAYDTTTRGTLMDIGSISAALSGLKGAFELTKAAVAARDQSKLAEAKQVLDERIFDVTNAALQLQEKLSAARDEIDALKDDKRKISAHVAELEQGQSERAKYRLHELSEGVFVLAYNGGSTLDEMTDPAHYLCQSCMDNASKKEVLQTRQNHGRINLHCNACNSSFFTGKTYQIKMPRLY